VNTNNIKGKTKKSATIFSNDPQKPKSQISLSGLVKQYISVEPGSRVLFKGYAGDKIKKKLTITSLEEQPLKITNITSTVEDKIKYKLKTIEKGKEYSLEIKTRSGIKESFTGKLVLKTNSPKKPQLDISVMGKVQSQIKVAPQFVYFGVIDTSKEGINPNSLKRTVMISNARGDGLTIEKIEPSDDWISTDTQTDQEGKKYSIVIKLDKNKLPKGKFEGKIKIHTKHKKTSEVADVIIEGKAI